MVAQEMSARTTTTTKNVHPFSQNALWLCHCAPFFRFSIQHFYAAHDDNETEKKTEHKSLNRVKQWNNNNGNGKKCSTKWPIDIFTHSSQHQHGQHRQSDIERIAGIKKSPTKMENTTKMTDARAVWSLYFFLLLFARANVQGDQK